MTTTLLDKGLEYTLDNNAGTWPDGTSNCVKIGSPNPPYTWAAVDMDLIEDRTLSGFRVAVRYYERYQSTLTTPLPLASGGSAKTGDIYLEFPEFEIVSQTLTKKTPDRQVFRTDEGDELFGVTPGTYGPFGDKELCEVFAASSESGSYVPKTSFADNSTTGPKGGIKDGTAYTYGRVFNECTVTYLPRLSTSKQGPVKLLGAIPVDPHFPDADPPQYPMDAMYTLKPDPRSVVTMTYTLTTIYKVGNQSFTHSIDINQSVTQNPELYLGQKMEALAQTTYYYHGLQHEGLYPWYTKPNYDGNGVLIGEITEPTTMDELTRSDFPYKELGVSPQAPRPVNDTFTDATGDTWTWNGNTWMYQEPGTGVYKDVLNDPYEWNGTEWVKL